MRKIAIKILGSVLSCLFLGALEEAIAMDIEEQTIESKIPMIAKMQPCLEKIAMKDYDRAYLLFITALRDPVYCPGGWAFEQIVNMALNEHCIDNFVIEDSGVSQESLNELVEINKRKYVTVIFPSIYKMIRSSMR
ncbi:MAG: hypothetical protein LBB25_02070 [Holosporaceae bacterium]|jgi:hypothetical protein|nr:hypothetical protein [Holosporaceae bacterium]